MNKIEGVEIQVFTGETAQHNLTVDDDGYLSRLVSGTLTIKAKVAPGLPIYGFGVDGKKNVVRLKNWTPADEQERGVGDEFSARVWIVVFCCIARVAPVKEEEAPSFFRLDKPRIDLLQMLVRALIIA